MVGGLGALMAAEGVVGVWPLQAATVASGRNIILFTTDQQQELRWFPEGWEEENLPGLTRLRNTGVSFTRAYTNTAMCTPARTTLFTGLYPAQHGNVDTLSEGNTQSHDEHQLDPSLPNIATVMNAAGYDVVWKGKWHLSKGLEFPDGSAVSEDIGRYGMTGWNSPDAGGDAKLMNYAGGNTDHDGRYLDGTTWQAPTGAPSDPDYIFTQADGPVNADYERESVMAFLRHKIANPGGNPFCLIICLINPHDVLGCPGVSTTEGGNGTYLEGGYYGREDGSSPWSEPTGSLPIGLPPTKAENLLTNLKPTAHANFLALNAVGLGPVITDALKLQYVNFYGNLIKLADRNLCKILDLLDGLDNSVDPASAQALRNNSWLIFSSDHGDGAMCHGGLRQKSFMVYEEVLNVPLIWSNPVDFPSGPRVCDQLVSHVDFLPTLCSIVGVKPRQYQFKGVDYSSLLKNPDGPAVQDSILFTFDDIYCGQEASGSPNGIVNAPNRIRAIIEKDYKYASYFDGTGVASPQDEFYDLRSKANSGTDTDQDNGLNGTTGQAAEYTNYSVWAENQRSVKKATPALAAQRTRMMTSLKRAIGTKLKPHPRRPAIAPQDFKVELMNYTDSYGQKFCDLNITWLSRSSTQYQLQMSRDQKTWTNADAPVVGTNGPMLISQSVTDFKAFYRLAWSAAPAK